MKEYRTVRTEGNAEIVEKKSRFIARAVHVDTEEEALAFIESVKKKHYDARHNCWAYVSGERSENVRASDDGEPQGTAGRPILDVIMSAGLTFTCIVVTRYFGGTLLGTGGLVRAYTSAADAAVKNAGKVKMLETDIVSVKADYTDIGKLQYLFAGNGAEILSSEYGADVSFRIRVKCSDTKHLLDLITENTAGRASAEQLESMFAEVPD